MTTAAIYIRVSTEEQAEQNISIPAQKSRLISYCHSKGWDVADIYIDEGFSGKNLERPEITRLINDAQQQKFDTVLVWKLDRLSRRQQHVMYVIEEVLMPGAIDFASVTENFDTSTPIGRAMLGIIAVFAQLERETIVERVNWAKKEAAQQGRFMGGPPPFGYSHNPATKGLEINEKESEIVRWIYDEYLKGDHGFAYLADQLNKRGVPTPRGAAAWRTDQTLRIIRNPTYAGYLHHHKVLHQGRHPAIIPLDKWEAAQKMAVNKANIRVGGDGLFKGLIYCDHCGSRVRLKPVNRSNKGSQYYYVCYSVDKCAAHMVIDPDCPGRHHNAGKLEQKIIDKLLKLSAKPARIREAAQKKLNAAATKTPPPKTTKQLKKELDETKRRIKKWQLAFESDEIDLGEMRERVTELKERRIYLEKEIDKINHAAAVIEQAELSLDDMELRMGNFRFMWDKATQEERRSMVLETVDKIRLNRDGETIIEWNTGNL